MATEVAGMERCSIKVLLERCSRPVKLYTMTDRSERRAEPLSREQIVATAIAILDEGGADALTFRTLAARLATGSGAIYWHVADKQTLLTAATDQLVAQAIAHVNGGASPNEAIRVLALGVFDAIDAHPWVGVQLANDPWQPAVLRILEAVGAQVTALGVPKQARFNAATALLRFILGLAGQYAVGSSRFGGEMDRTTLLTEVAARWVQLDPVEHPFVRQVAAELSGHDDRQQFLAGVDLILAGIERSRRPTRDTSR
ncbi:TetR/AcrR family transcriptional regulator [Caulobacter sp. S45]|uniref:TetR/AcrR family transcriptional regulator n=1 Tax=Caulobacter sp. S45 TaxID=1641861 RepID=UPI0020C5D5F9|nr:TetR family transcriptional regulator [Caulobacter sp. S45]